MKKTCTNRTAAVTLAVVLCVSSGAFAAPRERAGEEGKRGTIVRIIKKIQKILGVSTHSEIPSPPIPSKP